MTFRSFKYSIGTTMLAGLLATAAFAQTPASDPYGPAGPPPGMQQQGQYLSSPTIRVSTDSRVTRRTPISSRVQRPNSRPQRPSPTCSRPSCHPRLPAARSPRRRLHLDPRLLGMERNRLRVGRWSLGCTSLRWRSLDPRLLGLGLRRLLLVPRLLGTLRRLLRWHQLRLRLLRHRLLRRILGRWPLLVQPRLLQHRPRLRLPHLHPRLLRILRTPGRQQLRPQHLDRATIAQHPASVDPASTVALTLLRRKPFQLQRLVRQRSALLQRKCWLQLRRTQLRPTEPEL